MSELVVSGQALPFAPNGRTCRERAAFPVPDQDEWLALLDEARAFNPDWDTYQRDLAAPMRSFVVAVAEILRSTVAPAIRAEPVVSAVPRQS